MPIFGISTCASEKAHKQLANRLLRRKVKLAIARGDDMLPRLRDVSNVRDMGKEGRQYLPDRPEMMRK